MLPLVAVFGRALVLLLTWMGSIRSDFRVPLGVWGVLLALMHDPSYGVFWVFFLGIAWVLGWNRLPSESFCGSFRRLA